MKKEQIKLRGLTNEGYISETITLTSKDHKDLMDKNHTDKKEEFIRLFERKTKKKIIMKTIIFDGTISEIKSREVKRLKKIGERLMLNLETS